MSEKLIVSWEDYNRTVEKLAIMVASGFNEEQFLIIQKTILAAEGSYTIVSRDIGTTNGWASEKWGLSYPVHHQNLRPV